MVVDNVLVTIPEQEALVKRIRGKLRELGASFEDEASKVANLEWLALRTALRTEQARLGRMRHPSRAVMYVNRYNAKKRGGLDVGEEACLPEHFEGMCAYCGLNKAVCTDHIVPISKGGSTIKGNVLPACNSCNSMKGSKTVYEFLSWLDIRDTRLREEIAQRRLARAKVYEYLASLAVHSAVSLE